jgi:hypothetical protein
MTQEDNVFHFVARGLYGTGATEQEIRFATLIAAAQREKLAHWMRSMGYATGHGDTVEDLLGELRTQIAERLLMEREACAKVCDAVAKKMDDEGEGPTGYIAWVTDCTTAIRARGNK